MVASGDAAALLSYKGVWEPQWGQASALAGSMHTQVLQAIGVFSFWSCSTSAFMQEYARLSAQGRKSVQSASMFASATTTRTIKAIIRIQLISFLPFICYPDDFSYCVFSLFIQSRMQNTAHSDFCWLNRMRQAHLHRKSLFSGKSVQEQTARSPQQKERAVEKKEQTQSSWSRPGKDGRNLSRRQGSC